MTGIPTSAGLEAGDGPVEREIDRLRLAALQTNSNEDKAAYYLAVSKWFQDRHYRLLATPPQAVAPTEEIAELKRQIAQTIDHLIVNDDGAVPWSHVANARDEVVRIVAAALTALSARLAEVERDNIVAPAECDANCDDPDCPYSHRPLTLRQAYENAVARLRASEAEATSLRRKLGELLAVIHRDGGHYEDFAGTEQAVADAQSTVVLLFQAQDERNDLRRKLEEARKALEPFGKWSVALDSEFADHGGVVIAAGIHGAYVTFGDLRRARALTSDGGANG